MDIKQAIERIVSGQNLTGSEMSLIMRSIMNGAVTPAQIGGFLVGLRIKGETVEEIAAAAMVMRELACGVELADLPNVVDIVGTGGDQSLTFNVSTASMFVAAAAGCNVAKHGNRSVSSRSGSADVLEAAGINLNLTPTQVAQCVRELGVGFMFAPKYHEALRYAMGPRRELGIRTLFNVLGPLTNPAHAPHQVLGVFSADLVMPLAEVLQRLGSKRALVVYGLDGIDEISISAETEVAELRDDSIRSYRLKPESFGINRAPRSSLQVYSPEESLAVIKKVLDNQLIPARDVVALNAGAAIYTAGIANSLLEGYAKADAVISSGQAAYKFTSLIQLTQTLASAIR